MICSLCTGTLLLYVAIGYLIARFIWELLPIGDLSSKAVFITGCDSGFGRSLAIKCAKNGMTVFAGCLTEEGQNSLKKEAASLPLHVVPLDVTQDESVKKAREYVDKNLGSKKLWAVVNNAGIFTCYGMADWCSIHEYQLSFEVNTLGGIRVTNAFVDLIKSSRGRIVSVSSVAGKVSLGGAAPYSVAKYGVEAWMDAVRRELRVFGVQAILLEPGAFKATNLLDQEAMAKRVDSVWKKMNEEKKKEYGEEFKNKFVEGWNKTLQMTGSDNIAYVVDNYYHAITAKYPRSRYQCGWDAIFFYYPVSFLPTPIQDAIIGFLTSVTYGGYAPTAVQPGGKYHQKTE